MADEQQSGQAENQGQKQPQDEPQAQQATLDQLLQGRDTTTEAQVIESDRQERHGHGINEAYFEEGRN